MQMPQHKQAHRLAPLRRQLPARQPWVNQQQQQRHRQRLEDQELPSPQVLIAGWRNGQLRALPRWMPRLVQQPLDHPVRLLDACLVSECVVSTLLCVSVFVPMINTASPVFCRAIGHAAAYMSTASDLAVQP